MSLIHADDKIIKLCENIGKGSSKRLFEFVEVELRVRLAVEDLPDVENENLDF